MDDGFKILQYGQTWAHQIEDSWGHPPYDPWAPLPASMIPLVAIGSSSSSGDLQTVQARGSGAGISRT